MPAPAGKAEQLAARPRPARPQAAGRVRWLAAGLLAVCLGVLGLAAALEPDPRGYGTHQQLGVGPCGMLIRTGLPCPTCGMTTAFAHAVRGRWLRAFWAQPAGFVLALATMAGAALSVWMLLRGRWPGVNLLWLTPLRLLLGLLLLLLGGWGFKLVAGLLTGAFPAGPVRL